MTKIFFTSHIQSIISGNIVLVELQRENCMRRNYHFYVYIVTNKNKTVLYTGVTNNLSRRLAEHRQHVNPSCFTARYACYYLVYYEQYSYINQAIARETSLKGILRSKKEKLISDFNPGWKFLNAGY